VLPYTYHWNSIPVQTTQIATNLPAGVYDVTVTDHSGCTATNTVTILGFPAPTDTIATIVGAKCNKSDGLLTVTVNGGTPPYLYLWNTTPAQSGPTASNIPAGTYSVSITDANGCHATATAVVPNTNIPTATVSSTDAYCGNANGTATVTAAGGSGGFTYYWSNNQITAIDTGLTGGIYTVTVTDDSNCTVTATISVTNIPGPTAGFTEQPKILTLLDGPVTFTDNSIDNFPGNFIVSWSWNFGDLTLGSGSYIQHQYSNLGTYLVTLIVTDNHGCKDTISDTIKIKDYYTFYIPNAFSPNSDGLNDLFYPSGNDVDSNNFSMMIYDRWGNLVFQTNKWCITHDLIGHGEGWNGTKNNLGSLNSVEMDVYVYRIRLTDLNGIKHE
ncbi:MAG: PKD domain-containing protein, partial [Bacteroidales bacterium]